MNDVHISDPRYWQTPIQAILSAVLKSNEMKERVTGRRQKGTNGTKRLNDKRAEWTHFINPIRIPTSLEMILETQFNSLDESLERIQSLPTCPIVSCRGM